MVRLGATATRRKPGVAWLAILALTIWDLNDASGPKGVPSASTFLALVAGLLLIGVAMGRTTVAIPATSAVLVWSCLTVGTFMLLKRGDLELQYVSAEMGTFAFYGICLVFATMYFAELTSTRTVVAFVVAYTAIAVFAVVAAQTNLRPAYAWNDRWDPPYYMLYGGLALLTQSARSLTMRLVLLGLTASMLALGLFSGNRTQFLLGVIFVVLAWSRSRRALYLMTLALLLVVAARVAGLIKSDPLTSLLQESRFSLLQGGLDDSLLGRVVEIQDIWYHITVLNSPLQTVLGRGVGAPWYPINRVLEGAPTEVYYLHSGIAHFAYHYGVLGVALFGYWVYIAVSRLPDLRHEHSLGERFWTLGAIGFSLNFFLQNSLYDPPAVLAMAVTLVALHRRRKKAAHDAGASSRSSSARARTSPRRESARVPHDLQLSGS